MPAYPIYLEPPATLGGEVFAQEAMIRMLEPPLTVAGVQYANESDASLARRQEAMKRVREAHRKARLMDHCVWCDRAILDGEPTILLSGRPMHVARCQGEFDQMLSSDRRSANEVSQ